MRDYGGSRARRCSSKDALPHRRLDWRWWVIGRAWLAAEFCSKCASRVVRPAALVVHASRRRLHSRKRIRWEDYGTDWMALAPRSRFRRSLTKFEFDHDWNMMLIRHVHKHPPEYRLGVMSEAERLPEYKDGQDNP